MFHANVTLIYLCIYRHVHIVLIHYIPDDMHLNLYFVRRHMILAFWTLNILSRLELSWLL